MMDWTHMDTSIYLPLCLCEYCCILIPRLSTLDVVSCFSPIIAFTGYTDGCISRCSINTFTNLTTNGSVRLFHFGHYSQLMRVLSPDAFLIPCIPPSRWIPAIGAIPPLHLPVSSSSNVISRTIRASQLLEHFCTWYIHLILCLRPSFDKSVDS
jgi:hypothetical protein